MSEPSSANSASQPPVAPVVSPTPQPVVVQPKRKRSKALYIIVLLLIVSVIYNVVLILNVQALMAPGMSPDVQEKGDEKQVIATYFVRGVLDDERAEDFAAFYQAIYKDDRVKAVVLVVDSPGGGVAASDRIRQLIELLQKRGKKIVICMETVAASGGYWISANADWIVCEPETITGSIGVLAQLPDVSGTMELLGFKFRTIKSNEAKVWKAMLDPTRAPHEYEIDRLLEILNDAQGRFNQLVLTGRKGKITPKKEAVEITIGEGDKKRTETVETNVPLNGEIFVGHEALALGLVDELGFRTDAMKKAAELANLDNPQIVVYRRSKGLLGSLLGAKTSAISIDADAIQTLKTPQIMAIWQVE